MDRGHGQPAARPEHRHRRDRPLLRADLTPWLPRLRWVTVGGKSGREARPCNVEWVRSVVRQCQATGVAVFVKQLGDLPIGGEAGLGLLGKKGGRWRRGRKTSG